VRCDNSQERFTGSPHEILVFLLRFDKIALGDTIEIWDTKESAMLKIIFGEVENSIYHPPTYFDNQYEDAWITDPLSVAMIKDIDNSDVVGVHLIESPVLGPISTKEISGGVKTLILMAFDRSGKIFNASACGDNCAKWIVELGKRQDLTINLHHVMDFSAVETFDALMLNTGKVVHNYGEYLDEALRIKER
jgi:hypothetical protein